MSTTQDLTAPDWKQMRYEEMLNMTPLQAVESALIVALTSLKQVDVSNMTEPRPHSTRRNKVTHAEWQRRDSFARGLATAIAYIRQGNGYLDGAGNTADNIRSEFWAKA